jgi:tetratricopeptide (TPR) repeat protein
VDAEFRLGVVQYYEGQLENAEAVFRAVQEKNPDWPAPHVWLGRLHYWRGELDQAISELAKAVALNPADATAHLELGDGYYAQEDYVLAKSEYERAIALAPKNVDARERLASAYYAQNQFTAAQREYERALAEASSSRGAPDEAENRNLEVGLRNGLGYTYLKLNQAEDARREFERAIELNPDEAMPRLNLGIIHAQQDRPGEARAAWETAMPLLTGTDPISRLARGFYGSMLGIPEAATELQDTLSDRTVNAGWLRELLSDAELLAETKMGRTRARALTAQLRRAIDERRPQASALGSPRR